MVAVGGSCLAMLGCSNLDTGQDADKLKLFVVSKVAIIVHCCTSRKLAFVVKQALQFLTREYMITTKREDQVGCNTSGSQMHESAET